MRFQLKKSAMAILLNPLLLYLVSVLQKLFFFLKVTKSKSKQHLNIMNVHVRYRKELYVQVTQFDFFFICFYIVMKWNSTVYHDN